MGTATTDTVWATPDTATATDTDTVWAMPDTEATDTATDTAVDTATTARGLLMPSPLLSPRLMLTTATTDAVWDTPDTDTATDTPDTATIWTRLRIRPRLRLLRLDFQTAAKQHKQAVLHQDLSLKNG